MRAKLIVEGREFPIEIHDPELQKLLKPQKKTGYERVEKGNKYFYTCSDASVCSIEDCRDESGNDDYNSADYYSDHTIAENNARADKLMRQLRRFAVEHRENSINWNNETTKYYIRFGHGDKSIWAESEILGQGFGMITFDSKETCILAIDTFRDELIWYFTEYKDSL